MILRWFEAILTNSTLAVVLDASVALSAIFPDEVLNSNAVALLRDLAARSAILVAPPLWESETSSAVRLRVSQKKILSPSLETLVYSLLDALPIQIVHDPNVLVQARQLAMTFNRTRVYDAIYLALAQLHGLEFWTGDERLYNAVAGKDAPKGQALSFVHFLGHFTP